MWRSKRQTSIWIHETRKEIHYNLVASCLPKLHSDPIFSIALFSPLGPPKSRNSAALPATPGPAPRRLVLYRPFTRTLPFLQGSCNPIRLLEAAELLEADQRKHEGGQSKETSSVLDSTSFGSSPMIFWSRRLVARPDQPWLSKPMLF